VIYSPLNRNTADGYIRYNTTKYSDPFWKAFVTYIHCLRLDILTMCAILRLAAGSLVHDGKLRDDLDLKAIALGLKHYI